MVSVKVGQARHPVKRLTFGILLRSSFVKRNILFPVLNLIAAGCFLFVGISNYYKGITNTSYLFIIAGILLIVSAVIGFFTKKKKTNS